MLDNTIGLAIAVLVVAAVCCGVYLAVRRVWAETSRNSLGCGCEPVALEPTYGCRVCPHKSCAAHRDRPHQHLCTCNRAPHGPSCPLWPAP